MARPMRSASTSAAGGLPGMDKGHRRDCKQVDAISDERDEPVPAGFIGDVAGDSAQAISKQLTQSRNNADCRRASAQGAEKRTIDAGAALIGSVGE